MSTLSVALLILLPTLFLILYRKCLSSTGNRNNRSPPSPPKLPIIGNLHQLGNFPHRSLRSLSNLYGDLMLLHFGSKPTLVVSSPDAAKQIMKTHDVIFANRPNLRLIKHIFYDGNEIAFGRYGDKWRRMKSIAVTQLLCTKKVQSFQAIMEEEVGIMVEKIKSNGIACVNLSVVFLRLLNDMMNRTTLGKSRNNKMEGDSSKFEEVFKELVEVMGEFSVGDFIPWLGWIDVISGLRSKAERVKRGFDDIFDKAVQEHVDVVNNGDDNNVVGDEEKIMDFVHVLLQVQKDDPTSLSNNDLYGLLLDTFSAGIVTTQTLLEWTMTEIVRHPKILKRLQEEVRQIVNNNEKGVREEDLKNMHYLKAVIKETLRLHPPAPLLVFRESSQNVEINGYEIDAKTQVIINAWAIQRNPDSWEEGEEFNPERFLTNSSSSKLDFKGQHFEFIPFGAGRRSCPGASYGLASVELAIASLLYEFDWKLPHGFELESLDIEESVGATTHRRYPLMLIPIPHFS